MLPRHGQRGDEDIDADVVQYFPSMDMFSEEPKREYEVYWLRRFGES